MEALPYTPEGYNRTKSILPEKFGKVNEIVKAYVREILDLPYIATADTKQIHDFCQKLTYNTQSLQTLKKLNQVDGAVALVLDKLPAVRGDLVHTDVNWEKWNFVQFSEALRLWTRRNPVDTLNTEDKTRRRQRAGQIYNTQQRDHTKPHACVYCDSHDHKSTVCPKVETPIGRRKILSQKKLCFNCTGGSQSAAECRSTTTCRNCAKRHHTSICESKPKAESLLSVHQPDESEVIYPIVLVGVDGIKTRALLDTCAGSCYASAQLIDALHKRPTEIRTKRIEMMLGSTTTKVENYAA